MARYWRILIPVLAVSVFAGIFLQLSSILSSDPAGAVLRSGEGFMDRFGSLVSGSDSPDAPVHGEGLPGDDMLSIPKGEVELLRAPFLPGIHDPVVQVKAIENIQRHLKSYYPWTPQDRTGEAIGLVFPEDREELIAMYGRLSRYSAWLKRELPGLMGMGKADRERILWDTRREIFGREADLIWAGELKSEQVLGNLDRIDPQRGVTLTGKLAVFEDTIRKTYGKDAGAYMDTHRQELLEKFFTMPGVQAELGGMDPGTRRESLMAARRALGMDDETLTRWERLDRLRDGRWDRGRAYMDERRRIAGTFRGAERDRMLVELREKYFGAEAVTVAGEEQAGYYRFRVQRIHGLN